MFHQGRRHFGTHCPLHFWVPVSSHIDRPAMRTDNSKSLKDLRFYLPLRVFCELFLYDAKIHSTLEITVSVSLTQFPFPFSDTMRKYPPFTLLTCLYTSNRSYSALLCENMADLFSKNIRYCLCFICFSDQLVQYSTTTAYYGFTLRFT